LPTTAYLFFEDEAANTLDPASAQDVAQLLLDHQIPLAVLNACQSGQETGDAATQRLLLCLFPFTGVIWVDQLDNYVKHLTTQSPIPTTPFAQFPAVLKAAQEWGLLTPHEIKGYLRLQPVLPYFLKTRLAQEPAEVKAAIETAFREHYAELAEALFNAFEAKDPQQRQTARLLTQVEYENLTTALQRCLADPIAFAHLYAVLGLYLDSVQDHHRRIELGQSILAQMEHYPAEVRFGAAASSFLRVMGELGRRQMTLKRYDEAAASYQAAAELIEQITNVSAVTKGSWQATTYHQLGMVAQEQRQ
jgi:tetratricopeptide (TPR) repeat protein